MKNVFFITLIVFVNIQVFSQDYSKLPDYRFKDAKDYKTTENQVLECANYLFNTAYNTNELNRLSSIQYIMKWMEGTPDYTFTIGDNAMKLTKGNSNLLGLYFAAMAKVVLENKEIQMSNEDIDKKATDILVKYCGNPDNNIKPSKAIKKILKENN
jgi:hypothetical protein